ncbi:glycosyltransferase family 2 protein [Flavobacterium sp. NRK F7]|uniref:glycosyltransferase n=1 Tax=Flavobacterium sp. NRK F7 TaxID=2954930 RepID=UPI0020909FB9|nr:glycosyltransferase family 2 protein [Flavobacterium sp. NRK F7]MCO6162829.1 glycosyltransferase family 2 protein [Flavobacterium sp. NRK F7]
MLFSFIIPVYNRPEEIEELLQSMTHFDFKAPFEVVIVEDGSSVPCEHIVENYKNKLQISYYFKSNSGPGNSRNFGMQKAKGDYFIILDSDCILPKEYLTVVSQSLQNHYVDCFGGPDKALPTFSNIQKAINFSMTSFLTTGGIRGGSEKVDKFQPRSFNMGLSKNAFEISKGFGNIHPGEDPDLSIRLWELGLQTKLLKEAYVYHKRRIDWNKFYIQVNKFGKARPILNFWYPKYTKLTFWFPSFFLFGFVLSLILILFSLPILFYLYLIYFGMIFVSSLVQNKSATIAVYSIIATAIQFYGYGIGYLKSFINVFFLKKKPQQAHPELFF